MDEFAVPKSERPVTSDADEAAVQRGLAALRPVAILLGLCGILFGANAAQVVLFALWQSPEILAGEVGSAAFALAYLALVSRVYDGDHRGVMLAILVVAAGGVFAAGWTVFLLANGALSVLAPLVAAGSALFALRTATLLPTTAGIAAARRRLSE